jgi:hypothetical protein
MSRWQNWALAVIEKFLAKDSTALSSAHFHAIYDLSYLLSADSLQQNTTRIWLGRINAGNLPISEALGVAELRGARPFLTQLYVQLVNRLSGPAGALPGPMKIHFRGLAQIHIQRLLVGYYSLNETWRRFRHARIPLARHPTCVLERHARLCQPPFMLKWEHAMSEGEQVPITTIGHRIQTAISSFRSVTMPFVIQDTVWSGMPCPYLFSSSPDDPLVRLIGAIPTSLEGYFFGTNLLLRSCALSEGYIHQLLMIDPFDTKTAMETCIMLCRCMYYYTAIW